MSRPVRIEYPGAYYLVTSKGNRGQEVYVDEEDRKVFLNVVAMVVERFGWVLHAYAMMSDHYHLVVSVPAANLSRGMRQLNGVYTQHFNRKHGLEGSLFHGRFRSILFEQDGYLQEICRHVVMNPVRSGDGTSAEKCRWTSHRAASGLIKMPAFLDCTELVASFGRRPVDAIRKYRAFVKAGLGGQSPLDDREHQVLLGSDEFVARLQPVLDGTKAAKIGPRRVGRKRTLKSMFKPAAGKDREVRNEIILRAHVEYGYTLSEIGEHLGLHYTTVSKVINAAGRG